MKRLMTCVALVGALAFGAGSAWTQDQPHGDAHKDKGATVTLSDAAAKAIAAAFPNAKVEKVGLVGRADAKLFSATLSEGDKTCTVQVTDDGVIIRVTTPVGDLSALPKAVTDAVNAASDGARITSAAKVELRADPKTPHTAYDKAKISCEVRFTGKDGAKSSMEVADDGTVIRAPKASTPPADKPAAPKS